MRILLFAPFYLVGCFICFNAHSYSKIFMELISTQAPTWHPKVSKREIWELKNSLASIERLLNQDILEPQEREHVLILVKYYIAGPLMLCKSLHCSRCDFYNYQRIETLKILNKCKFGQSIIDSLASDPYFKEYSFFLSELEQMRTQK